METWDAIRARRNIRSYADEALDPQTLERILEAGRRAPSAKNQQRWDFVLCTDREQLTELSRVWRGAGHVAGSAATIALVAPDEEDPATRGSIRFDLGQAAMAMLLAATDLGVASGHAAVQDQPRARNVLGLPDDRFCALLIALGRPRGSQLTPIEEPDRRAFADVVHRGRW